jgi:RAD51-like protein 1
MLSVIASMPAAFGGGGGGVIYVDTESRFSSARLVEIATGRFPQCYNSASAVEELMKSIVVITPHSTQELLEVISPPFRCTPAQSCPPSMRSAAARMCG